MARTCQNAQRALVPETGIEPVRPFSGKRRILSPLCLPISPLGHAWIVKQKTPFNRGEGASHLAQALRDLEARPGVEPGSTDLQSVA